MCVRLAYSGREVRGQINQWKKGTGLPGLTISSWCLLGIRGGGREDRDSWSLIQPKVFCLHKYPVSPFFFNVLCSWKLLKSKRWNPAVGFCALDSDWPQSSRTLRSGVQLVVNVGTLCKIWPAAGSWDLEHPKAWLELQGLVTLSRNGVTLCLYNWENWAGRRDWQRSTSANPFRIPAEFITEESLASVPVILPHFPLHHSQSCASLISAQPWQ